MPGVESSGAGAGSEVGGFRISGAQTALRIRVWGYWGSDVVAAFTREAPAACQQLTAAAVFILEADELKPQGAEGQEALRVLFRSLAARTFAAGNVVAGNVLTRMQLTRLVRECGLFEQVRFVEKST